MCPYVNYNDHQLRNQYYKTNIFWTLYYCLHNEERLIFIFVSIMTENLEFSHRPAQGSGY